MLFGVKVGDITFSSESKGFFAVCCACGTNHKIKTYPYLGPVGITKENITGAHQMYVIIECKECDQIVHVYQDGTSEIIQESKHGA